MIDVIANNAMQMHKILKEEPDNLGLGRALAFYYLKTYAVAPR